MLSCHSRALLAFAATILAVGKAKTLRRLQTHGDSNSSRDLFALQCSGHGYWKLFPWRCVCNIGWEGELCAEASAPRAVEEACSTPAGNNSQASCEWYPTCLTARYPFCSEHEDEYAESYGRRFCQAFKESARAGRFSDSGKQWINNVMLCLQTSLVNDLFQDSDPSSCTEVRGTAFDSHPSCYLKPAVGASGICDLELQDLVKIVEITWDALFSVESIRQIVSVAKGCVQQWSQVGETVAADGYSKDLQKMLEGE